MAIFSNILLKTGRTGIEQQLLRLLRSPILKICSTLEFFRNLGIQTVVRDLFKIVVTNRDTEILISLKKNGTSKDMRFFFLSKRD